MSDEVSLQTGLQVCADATALDAPQRDERGRLLPGNSIRASHGLFSERDLANLRAEVQDWLARALVDEGGELEVTTRRRALLEYRARLHRRIAQLDNALEVKGLFDKRGKLRVAWLQQLTGLINGAKALDQVLGLARRLKRVPSLDEHVTTRYAAQGDE